MKTYVLTFLVLIPFALMAQSPVIEITGQQNDSGQNTPVQLEEMDISIQIAGNISTTTTTMVFKNHSNNVLETQLTFPLPDGVSVSGYALDIHGKLRAAVPVEKTKAKEVFETIQKRGVDPGIMEKVEGNNFRTRIYPFFAQQSRTIQITYHQKLKSNENGYQFFQPMDFSLIIPKFKVKVQVFDSPNIPKLEEQIDGSFVFKKDSHQYVAQLEKTNYRPNKSLKILIPKDSDSNTVLMQEASGNHYYFTAQVPVSSQSKNRELPKKIGLIWDNSLSGLQKDHTKEWAFLEAYFQKNPNVEVRLAFIHNEFEKAENFKIRKGNWSKLKDQLENVVYDGGTDLGQLRSMDDVEEYLLFSDGLSTFGDWDTPLDRPTYSIVSSARASFSLLQFMADQNCGEVINLQQNDVADEIKKVTHQQLRFLGIKKNASLSEVYPKRNEVIENDFSISGILSGKTGEVTLVFGYEDQPIIEKKILLDANTHKVENWEIAQFWAQQKISELQINPKANDQEIKTLGEEFGVVTQNTSLMVLESIHDYVQYNITPPEELRAEFDRIAKNNWRNREAYQNNRMDQAEKMIGTLKNWWATDFKGRKYPKPTHQTVYESPRVSPPPPPSAPETIILNQDEVAYSVVMEDDDIEMEVEDVAFFSNSRYSSPRNKTGKIKRIDVKSDAEYMPLFENLSHGEAIYSAYLKHRENFQTTPSYYLDVAQLLFDQQDKKTGLRVLSSIADLDLENEELYKLMAYQLKKEKFHEKELWVLGKVLEWRPFDPQSYRDYALALEGNGHYQAALDTLYQIFNKPYTREMGWRDNGIEETVLMELNQLISRHEDQLDTSCINYKLIADLPVDIRVVLNWNKDNVDIDLWLTDPNGEKCMYNHKETAIGGRLSRDFTRGFGPEQFILKKAIPGTYKIESNFYSNAERVSISGPTSMMAEVYTYYASGRQEREVIVFQREKKNLSGNTEGVLIGEFSF